MRDITVGMPFAGIVYLTVSAENEEDAKVKFHEQFDSLEKSDCYEWDFYEKMSSGNVRYYTYNKVEFEDNGEILN